MQDRIPITPKGLEKLKQELEELKAQRPEVIRLIAEAREEGDLSENGGYDAARERQGMLEAKIGHIQGRLPLFDVLDLDDMDGDMVTFGATVEIEDMETEEIKRYTLLGPDEADFSRGTISVFSPLGRALLGKHEGDEVVVDAPRGKIEYEIASVEFLGNAGLKS